MRSYFLLSTAIAGLCLAGMVMPGCAGKNEPKAFVASAQVAAAATTSPARGSSPTPDSPARETGQPGHPEQPGHLSPAGKSSSTPGSPAGQDSSTSLSGDTLILPGDISVLKSVVEQMQLSYVPASHNEFDCVTDVMYNRFREGNSAQKIAAEIVKLKEIQAAILTLRAMPAADMKKEVSKLRRPLRKTWGQLGRISSEGQTDAGQKAELLIANAIADKVLQCCQDPGWTPSQASR